MQCPSQVSIRLTTSFSYSQIDTYFRDIQFYLPSISVRFDKVMSGTTPTTLASDGPTVVTDMSDNVSQLLLNLRRGPDRWPQVEGYNEENPSYIVWASRKFVGKCLGVKEFPDLSGSPDSFAYTLLSRLADFDDRTTTGRWPDSLKMAQDIVRDTRREFGKTIDADDAVTETVGFNRRTSSRPDGPSSKAD